MYPSVKVKKNPALHGWTTRHIKFEQFKIIPIYTVNKTNSRIFPDKMKLYLQENGFCHIDDVAILWLKSCKR